MFSTLYLLKSSTNCLNLYNLLRYRCFIKIKAVFSTKFEKLRIRKGADAPFFNFRRWHFYLDQPLPAASSERIAVHVNYLSEYVGQPVVDHFSEMNSQKKYTVIQLVNQKYCR